MANRVEINKRMYGWSKYGGGMYGMVKGESDWFCQSCGSKQAKEMAQYMIPIDIFKRDYIRVCGICKHVQLRHKLNYRQLCFRFRVREIHEKK
jgi:hypothetical protein